MSSINKIMLIGRCGKDPVIKTSTSGTKYGTVTLATSEMYKTKTLEKKEITQWHNLKFFGSLSEIFERYVKKGHRIHVDGTIQYSEYEKDGHKMRATEILVKQVTLLEKPTQQDIDSVIQPEDDYVPQAGTNYNFEDDLPF